MSARLSAVLIVKNEADNIVACLESVTFADEIVVVDAGSTDTTRELAAQYTDKIYVHADWLGYGVQRQRAQAHATGEWIIMIDADQRVTAELREEIRGVGSCSSSHRNILPGDILPGDSKSNLGHNKGLELFALNYFTVK